MQSGNGLRKTAGRLRDCIMKRGIAAMNRNAETIVHIKKLFELCLNLRQAERSAVCQQQNGRIGLCIPQFGAGETASRARRMLSSSAKFLLHR